MKNPFAALRREKEQAIAEEKAHLAPLIEQHTQIVAILKNMKCEQGLFRLVSEAIQGHPKYTRAFLDRAVFLDESKVGAGRPLSGMLWSDSPWDYVLPLTKLKSFLSPTSQ